MLSDSNDLPAVCKSCQLILRLGDRDETFHEQFPAFLNMQASMSEEVVSNYFKVFDAYRKDVLPPEDAHPINIMVGFGNRCNFRCVMCGQDHADPLEISGQAIMKVKEAIPYIGNLTLVGGEPTIYKQCWELADYFTLHAPAGATLCLLTNLKWLTPERIEKHLGGIECLSVGINVDASTKPVYEYIRNGGNWEQYNENLSALLHYKKKHEKKYWRISQTILLMKSNLHQVVDFIKRCGELGTGFQCGPIAGLSAPSANVKTYLKENIFDFSHLGVKKEDINAVLYEALNYVDCLAEEHRFSARVNIEGSIKYTNDVIPYNIPSETVDKYLQLSDEECSRQVTEFLYPSPAVPLWRRAARKAKRILKKLIHY